MAIELTTATIEQLSDIRLALGAPLITDIFPNATYFTLTNVIQINNNRFGDTANFKNCGNVRLAILNNYTGDFKIQTILNAQDLTGLEDAGTSVALRLDGQNLSESALNQLFTDLPETNKTVTINVIGNPGAATCDPTIATAKGYTVITEEE